MDSESKKIDSYRTLTLRQFLDVFNTLKNQSDAMSGADVSLATVALECDPNTALKAVSDEACSLEECCICLERKPEIILPCAHSYCLPCIEQWNASNKTCPVCRETLCSTEDGWIVSEGPDSEELLTDIQKALMSLTL